MKFAGFVLALLLAQVVQAQWTIRTDPPNPERPNLVVFRADSIPLKITLSPGARFDMCHYCEVDTVSKTDSWHIKFAYFGHRLISFRGVALTIDGSEFEFLPQDKPWQESYDQFGITQVREWFEVQTTEDIVRTLSNAMEVKVSFRTASEIEPTKMKAKRIEYVAAYYSHVVKQRNRLIGNSLKTE